MAGSRALNSRYQIEEPPIGHGGMGVVYKAFDRVTRRFVALKTIKGSVDQSSIELFEKEWTILARLCHPNIVDILDIGEFSDNGERRPYFVMPLLPGETLEKIIKNSSRRLTPERAVEIVAQACRGLQAAHDKGLIHRDLKPSNLFVMDDDTVKIIDFGVVHLADARTVTSLKGTLQYMAPEQLESKPATTKSDLFSIGVVCYEALTGRRPFARSTEPEVIEAIRSHVPPPASQINSSVSDLISRSVHKAMAKQPYHRFGSVREFCETLQKASRNEHIEFFDGTKIRPRISRTKKALSDGDYQYAMEILNEIESEGHVDPEISLLRIQLEQAMRARTIRQLLEDARTRMEEDEFPLALQKVQNVLDIDSTNVDALAMRSDIERHRSVFQIDKWLSIAQQHLDSSLFSNARRAVDEVFKIDRSYKPAREMLAEIDRQEHESSRLREERNQLYQQALTAYRNGEISSALVKLERALDLGKKFPGHPQTDANYQAFYNQIRSERDELHNAYSEGRKAVDTHDFAAALKICNEVLSRRPGEPMFKALKLEVEESERQESSAAIAEFHRRAELEPDFDKKLAILKEAVGRFPNEPYFRQSSKLVKERRDLVNSIVARARHYESQKQYYEALGQWDIMRNIYAQYPGLEVEIDRLVRCRDEAARNDARATWVNKIDRALGSDNFAVAGQIASAALAAFPSDAEFGRLLEQAERGAHTLDRSRTLLEEGRKSAASGNYLVAIENLREARELNQQDSEIRSALVDTLVTYSHLLLAHGDNSALPFASEAIELEPLHAGARELALKIDGLAHGETAIYDSPGPHNPPPAVPSPPSAKLSVAAAATSGASQFYARGGPHAPSQRIDFAAYPETVVDQDPAATVLFSGETAEFIRPEIDGATATQETSAAETTFAFDALEPDRVQGGTETEIVPASLSGDAGEQREEKDPWTPARPRERSYEKNKSQRMLLKWLALALLMAAIGGSSWLAYSRYRGRQSEAAAAAPAGRNTAVDQHLAQTARPREYVPNTAAVQPMPAAPLPIVKNPRSIDKPASPGAAKALSGMPAMVQFRSNAPQAQLKVDDSEDLVCQLPCYLPLPYGQHKLLITAPNFYDARRIIQIPGDTNPYITLTPNLTTVHLNSEPAGAAVWVDGKEQGQTPVFLKLTRGEHQVRLSKGSWKYEGPITVGAGELQTITFR